MATLKISDKTIQTHYSVNEIYQPFLKHFNLNYFYHIRIKNKKYLSALVSRVDYYQYFCEQQCQFHNGEELPEGHYIGRCTKTDDSILDQAKQLFDLATFLNISIKRNDRYEIFGFSASAKNKEVVQVYHQHLKEFYCFANNFVNEAASQISVVDSSPEIMSSELKTTSPDSFKLVEPYEFPQHYVRDKVGDFQQLKKKEYAVLLRVQQNMTSKQIALELDLSYRTIEDIVVTLRKKLSCHSKSELAALCL